MTEGELERLAAIEELLVACDYDGTLAPIVDDPERAFPEEGAMEVLSRLAGCPGTQVAVVSGRSLEDLARLTGAPEGVTLVGSHGGELGERARLSSAQRDLKEEVGRMLEELGERFPGSTLEEKPAGFAFHHRRAVAPDREVVEAVERGPGSLEGVTVRRGKKVVELAVEEADKGSALEDLRRLLGAEAVVYLGDDLTDEDAFARLGEGDLAVKVGEGPTGASHRLAGPGDVVRFLENLARLRAPF